MRTFAGAWTAAIPIAQQAAGKLAWGHNMVCLNELDGIEARDWHATAAEPIARRERVPTLARRTRGYSPCLPMKSAMPGTVNATKPRSGV